ncbi:MAG: HD domain-containing protein [Simkaniaceae bacterium]
MYGQTRKIYDRIHGFIYFDALESQFIDTWAFQRLHFIRQLGAAFLVYPGATHTRFEHSIGTMHIASVIYDQIVSTASYYNFSEQILQQQVPEVGSLKYEYYRKILRLAALCHDLGHLPFSHTAESALLGTAGHEQWTIRIIQSPEIKKLLENFPKDLLRKIFGETDNKQQILEDLIKISIGEEKLRKIPGYEKTSFSPWERIVSHIITGDFFGADRIDYLLRDSKNTGLAYGFFDYHQLIEMLRIFPSLDSKENLQLGIEENGIESCEALLLARYYMHRRIYQYPSINAYTYHLASFMKNFYLHGNVLSDLDVYLSLTDAEILSQLNKAAKEPSSPSHRHALALLKRQGRFKAIPLKSAILESDMIRLQKTAQIPEEEIAWQLKQGSEIDATELDFPVIKKDGRMVRAIDISEIIVPVISYNWIFVSPQYEQKLRKLLA